MRNPATAIQGLSPLTRGKREVAEQLQGQIGTIPAHAGKTISNPAISASNRDYPRSRGENWACACTRPASVGLSPLTRGKRVGVGVGSSTVGTIPAHAGKTGCESVPPSPSTDYPRSRGENLPRRNAERCFRGLSPLTRGKPVAGDSCTVATGTIPAHAGKTRRARAFHRPTRDYPRSRGENYDGLGDQGEDLGLSPLTRGKPRIAGKYPGRSGTIPAHAGKTTQGFSSWCRMRDYPRSRGENYDSAHLRVFAMGLSPLTRGKPRKTSSTDGATGTIPAHAGKT